VNTTVTSSTAPERKRFDIASFTSKGGRQKNEDSIYAWQNEGQLFAVVADGLGAHGGGDIASAEAIASMRQSLPASGITSAAVLSECFSNANSAVLAKQIHGTAMKSTAVVLTAENGEAAFAHAGDSRGYVFHRGRITFQTMDHSVSQLSVLRGDITPGQIRFHKSRSQLMRALGAGETVAEDIKSIKPISVRDAFLLCSDGFWEYVTEAEMEIDLAKSPRSARKWLSLMLARIGKRIPDDHDNLSAVAIIYRG